MTLWKNDVMQRKHSYRFDKEGPLVFYEVAEGIPFDRGEGESTELLGSAAVTETIPINLLCCFSSGRKQADGSRKSTARSSLRRLACYGGTGGKGEHPQ